MKKIIVLIAALCLLLTACGQAAPGGEPGCRSGLGRRPDRRDTQQLFHDRPRRQQRGPERFCRPQAHDGECLGHLLRTVHLRDARARRLWPPSTRTRACSIVGLVSDVTDSDGNLDEAQLSLARDIVAETGANYLHVVPGEGLYGLLSQVSGVPTTLFVDSEGKQVGTAYIGAKDLDGWKAVADELLESLEA